MKQLLFTAAAVLAGFISHAQAPSAFELTPKGFTDFVVTDIAGKTKADLYKRTLDWIEVKVKNSEPKIKSQTPNETIVFEGKDKIVSLNGAMKLTYDSRYQIAVTFKDGKYKFDLLKLEYITAKTSTGGGGWRDFDLNDVSTYYTLQGELRPPNKFYPEIATYFNNLNADLKTFIESGATVPTKSNDW